MTDPNLKINALLDHLEASVTQQIKQRDVKDPLMVGIHTGGAWIATELHARLGLIEPVGLLDISFLPRRFLRNRNTAASKTKQITLQY